MRTPKALQGLIQPKVTIEQLRKRIRYEAAMNPAPELATPDEIEQFVYDVVARDPTMTRTAAANLAKKKYRVAGGAL